MAQLDQVTNTNTVTAQDSANAAEALSKQASSLKAQVVNLVSVINGNNENKESTLAKSKSYKIEKKVISKKVVVIEEAQKFQEVQKPIKGINNVFSIKEKEAPISRSNLKEVKIELKKTADQSTPVQQKFKEGVPRHDHPGFEDV